MKLWLALPLTANGKHSNKTCSQDTNVTATLSPTLPANWYTTTYISFLDSQYTSYTIKTEDRYIWSTICLAACFCANMFPNNLGLSAQK